MNRTRKMNPVTSMPMRRRSFITTLAGCTACALLNRSVWSLGAVLKFPDEWFRDDLSRRSFRYFWEQSNPQTGITCDRTRTDGAGYPDESHKIGSTGATGFGLTAMCIGAERKWGTR